MWLRGRGESRRRAGQSRGHPGGLGPGDMVKTWQCYALVLMFIGTTQSGLLVIGNAAGMLATTAKAIPFLAANAWILASYGGLVKPWAGWARVCTPTRSAGATPMP